MLFDRHEMEWGERVLLHFRFAEIVELIGPALAGIMHPHDALYRFESGLYKEKILPLQVGFWRSERDLNPRAAFDGLLP